MNKKDIDSVAYLLKQAKDNNQPKPIVFLGAGASISAGIPGTAKIIEDILTRFADKPEVKKLDPESRTNYYSVVACLNTSERHKVLREYITNDNVKINVTHIYLAQMLNEGYVDYVLTVNFDDLFLRACALFNFIPPVYDISILKDFTTTNLSKGSVTYLHGQHHGFWLLNTGEELEKVTTSVRTVFDRICNNRTWIVVGYSGEDTIFDQISRLENFTNELFWVGFNDNEPSDNVKKQLLEKPNSNASWIPGYDADAFFLKLHSELDMETPEIFNRPFSFLKGLMENIRDVDEKLITGRHQLLFENVKERYELAIKQVSDAINVYENGESIGALTKADISRDQLKQEIIEAGIKGKFELADSLRKRAKGNDKELNDLLADLFDNWGRDYLRKAKVTGEESLYLKSVEKRELANLLNPDNWYLLHNWGVSLDDFARKRKDAQLFEAALGKYNQALKLTSERPIIYKNKANSLIWLAKLGSPEQFERTIDDAIECALKAVELGGSSYNLSCCYALKKDKDKAFTLLEDVLVKELISVNHVLSDSDWKEYFDDEGFKVLISKYNK